MTGILGIVMHQMGPGRLDVPEAFELPPNARRTMQVSPRRAELHPGQRKSNGQVSPRPFLLWAATNPSQKTPSTRQVLPTMTGFPHRYYLNSSLFSNHLAPYQTSIMARTLEANPSSGPSNSQGKVHSPRIFDQRAGLSF